MRETRNANPEVFCGSFCLNPNLKFWSVLGRNLEIELIRHGSKQRLKDLLTLCAVLVGEEGQKKRAQEEDERKQG